MRTVVLALLLSASAFAQTPPSIPTAACGPGTVSFKVNLDASQHTLVEPEPGKARVCFIHDAGTDSTLGYPNVKVAVDGAWVGAIHGNSYFSVPVDVGEHHICVTLQTTHFWQRVELAHFTAAPDTVYYYRTRLVLSRAIDLLELAPIDSDQAKYLVASFPLSTSTPKK